MTKQEYKDRQHNGYTFLYIEGKYVVYSKVNDIGGFDVIKLKPNDFKNGNFEFMCENDISR